MFVSPLLVLPQQRFPFHEISSALVIGYQFRTNDHYARLIEMGVRVLPNFEESVVRRFVKGSQQRTDLVCVSETLPQEQKKAVRERFGESRVLVSRCSERLVTMLEERHRPTTAYRIISPYHQILYFGNA